MSHPLEVVPICNVMLSVSVVAVTGSPLSLIAVLFVSFIEMSGSTLRCNRFIYLFDFFERYCPRKSCFGTIPVKLNSEGHEVYQKI